MEQFALLGVVSSNYFSATEVLEIATQLATILSSGILLYIGWEAHKYRRMEKEDPDIQITEVYTREMGGDYEFDLEIQNKGFGTAKDIRATKASCEGKHKFISDNKKRMRRREEHAFTVKLESSTKELGDESLQFVVLQHNKGIEVLSVKQFLRDRS